MNAFLHRVGANKNSTVTFTFLFMNNFAFLLRYNYMRIFQDSKFLLLFIYSFFSRYVFISVTQVNA